MTVLNKIAIIDKALCSHERTLSSQDLCDPWVKVDCLDCGRTWREDRVTGDIVAIEPWPSNPLNLIRAKAPA